MKGFGARFRAWGRLLAVVTLAASVPVAVALAAGPPAGKGYFNDNDKRQQREETRPENQKYLVDVGSRLIAPGSEKAVRFKNGRARVYIQFERALTRPERVELIREGVRFHGALSGNTYLARLKPSARNVLEAHPLFRGMEEVLPEDRLTVALVWAVLRHGMI